MPITVSTLALERRWVDKIINHAHRIHRYNTDHGLKLCLINHILLSTLLVWFFAYSPCMPLVHCPSGHLNTFQVILLYKFMIFPESQGHLVLFVPYHALSIVVALLTILND